MVPPAARSPMLLLLFPLLACDGPLHPNDPEVFAAAAPTLANAKPEVPGVVYGALHSSRHLLETYLYQNYAFQAFIEYAIDHELDSTLGYVEIHEATDITLHLERARIDYSYLTIPYTAVVDATLHYPAWLSGHGPDLELVPYRMPLILHYQIDIDWPTEGAMNAAALRAWFETALARSDFRLPMAIGYRVGDDGTPVQVFP